MKIKRQKFSTFTLLLISKSYWFDKSQFIKLRENYCLLHPRLKLGAPPNQQTSNPRESKKIGDCRSSELPVVGDEAAESVDPTPVFPTDGAY